MAKGKKITAIFLSFLLLLQQAGFAQVAGEIDIAGHLAQMHRAFTVDRFRPLHLRYLNFNPQEGKFRLLLDKGNVPLLTQGNVKATSKNLLEYFFIGLALPNDTFWVNLRPDSSNEIIDVFLARTDVGRIMLETDLQLKKDVALATSPDTAEGKIYWDKLYRKAGEIFGNENVTIPTLTRPWIVPDEIIIRETGDSAYIYKATLKVMLEQDFLKGSATYNFKDERLKALNEYSSQLIRELIIPKISREVNSSKRYASLRQVYYSLIMAQWFKSRYKNIPTDYRRFIDARDLTMLTSAQPWSKETFFKEYQKSFKDGEYNMQVPAYTASGKVIRSYFSGGQMLLAETAIREGEFPGLDSNPPQQAGTTTVEMGTRGTGVPGEAKVDPELLAAAPETAGANLQLTPSVPKRQNIWQKVRGKAVSFILLSLAVFNMHAAPIKPPKDAAEAWARVKTIELQKPNPHIGMRGGEYLVKVNSWKFERDRA
ncbi:MAG: hypothetical protein NTU54_07060 [Candidatus Omnitrophica bacterium]|nr:hypothetical protein [Candidatus Omnitrophota bacterium]